MDSLDLAVLDPVPDPYWVCGLRSGSRSIENDQNDQIILVSAFQKGFCTVVGTVCVWANYLLYLYFSCNLTQIWVRIRNEIKSWIQIRIETNADPQHW
jgi:hypothetical protein